MKNATLRDWGYKPHSRPGVYRQKSDTDEHERNTDEQKGDNYESTRDQQADSRVDQWEGS